MTRQDTGAIVDAVMADVIGGGLSPQNDNSPKKELPDSPQDNGHV